MFKNELLERIKTRGYECMEVGNCVNFVGKREELVFDVFIDFDPVGRA